MFCSVKWHNYYLTSFSSLLRTCITNFNKLAVIRCHQNLLIKILNFFGAETLILDDRNKSIIEFQKQSNSFVCFRFQRLITVEVWKIDCEAPTLWHSTKKPTIIFQVYVCQAFDCSVSAFGCFVAKVVFNQTVENEVRSLV